MSALDNATAVMFNTIKNMLGTVSITRESYTVGNEGQFNPATGTNRTITTTTTVYTAVKYDDNSRSDTQNTFDEEDYLVQLTATGATSVPFKIRDTVLIGNSRFSVTDVQSYTASRICRIRIEDKV